MDAIALKLLFTSRLPIPLSADLVNEFVQIRQDVASRVLKRSSPGKFIEIVVQGLQHLERGRYEKQPDVDAYLKNLESRAKTLPEGLKICMSRVARAMYALRKQRDVLQKEEIDPNPYDLLFLLAGAQWIMTEFAREFSRGTMQGAGALVEQIQSPVGALVEDIKGSRLVHGDFTIRQEILVLLQSLYPHATSAGNIVGSLNRRKQAAVKKAIQELWRLKLIEGDAGNGYRLTAPGLRASAEIIRKATA